MSATQTTPRSSGVDLPTLVITAVASATAAYVTSEIWAPGTLASAAITPVIVALVKEALAKPADVVTRAVPVRGVVRSASGPGEPEQPPVQVYGGPSAQPAERVPQAGEIPGRSRPITGRAWKMAVITGLLGFVIAAVIITVPEFVAGKSASGGDRQTTFFGGDRDDRSDEPSREETTTQSDEEESDAPAPASTVTVAPVETTTVPPPETTTIPPAQTTTVPLPEEPPPPPAP